MELIPADLRLLCNLKGIFYFDAKVSHRAFDFGMSKEQLHGTWVLGASVDQGRLCTAHGVRTVRSNVQTDPRDPLNDDSCVLASGKVVGVVDPARKHIGVGLKLSLFDPGGNCFSRWRGDFKLNGRCVFC